MGCAASKPPPPYLVGEVKIVLTVQGAGAEAVNGDYVQVVSPHDERVRMYAKTNGMENS